MMMMMPFWGFFLGGGSDNYVVTEGWCVRTCGPGMFELEENGVQQCRECDGPCPKGSRTPSNGRGEAVEPRWLHPRGAPSIGLRWSAIDDAGRRQTASLTGPSPPPACDGIGVGALTNTIAVNASNIELFRNCTKINGDVHFIGTSFSG